MLTVCTWFWGNKYGVEDVLKLQAGVRRHLRQEHRFVVITDLPGKFEDTNVWAWCMNEEDRHLLEIKGCFVRLRMFDPVWQAQRKITGRAVCIDLDTVITGPLDPLFDRPEPFVILQGANASNPCPYNGSLWMLRPGVNDHVWSEFSLEAANRIPKHEFADDQGWLWVKAPNAAAWKAGVNGVYAFQKPGWPKGEALPVDARIVVFPGWRDPSKFVHLPWVREHWCQ
jgi:hypothetical protein